MAAKNDTMSGTRRNATQFDTPARARVQGAEIVKVEELYGRLNSLY
jgi:hypothetical protein